VSLIPPFGKPAGPTSTTPPHLTLFKPGQDFVANGIRVSQAKKMYESEREYIEGMYWEARDQLRQRLLALVEERRRKLREEKEGGDIVTGKFAWAEHDLAATDLGPMLLLPED